VRLKFKRWVKQAIKIYHHQQEWNHQVLKSIKRNVKFMVTIMDGALIKGRAPSNFPISRALEASPGN
jgi:hypothetical protein